MMTDGWVSACLPAYKSGRTLLRGIESVLSQTYEQSRIVVSVDGDGADTETKAALERYQDHPKVSLLFQEKQLGWVGNTNSAFEHVDTEFFFYLDHQDYIASDYIERLVTELRRHPDAVNCYGAIQWFGTSPGERSAPESLQGTIKQRFHTYLSQSLHGHPLRGVTRRLAIDNGVRIPENACQGLASDIGYMFRLTAQGECLLVPEATYFKYRSDETTSAGWSRFPAEKQAEAFVHLGQIVLDVAFEHLCPEDAQEFALPWVYEVCRFALIRSGLNDPITADMLFHELILRVGLGQRATSAVSFDALESMQQRPELADRLVAFKLTEASLHFARGAIFQAAAAYQAVTKLEPGRLEGHTGLAQTLERLSLSNEAFGSAQAALAIDPDNIHALSCCMRISVQRRDFDAASNFANRILVQDPGNKSAIANLARIEDSRKNQ